MAKNVLIIEDDRDILEIMRFILEEEGFQVICSVETVSFDYINKLNPALILLDNRLADGFGVDFCLKLKNDVSTRHYQVVIVSAINQLQKIAEDCSADAYLNKPFDLEDLISIVRRLT